MAHRPAHGDGCATVGPTLRTAPSPCGGGLGWVLPAYRRCPVAIPVSFQNFRVRVGYAATHPTHEIHHRVRLDAPSGAWRRLCDGGASPTLRTAPSPCGGGLGWGLPAYRRCPVAIPVSFQNFRVRVGYAATHPTHEIHHRVRLGAPSGAWRRLCDGGASPTLRTVRRSAIYGRQQKKRRA